MKYKITKFPRRLDKLLQKIIYFWWNLKFINDISIGFPCSQITEDNIKLHTYSSIVLFLSGTRDRTPVLWSRLCKSWQVNNNKLWFVKPLFLGAKQLYLSKFPSVRVSLLELDGEDARFKNILFLLSKLFRFMTTFARWSLGQAIKGLNV